LIAVLLLPAGERARWAEERKGELCLLSSRQARARFIASLLLAGGRELAVTLLLAGGRELAVTLRPARLGHKRAGRR
jgi:hypothetical protein